MGSYWSNEEIKPADEFIDVAEEIQQEKNEIKGDEILKADEMPPDVATKRRRRRKKKNRNKIKNGLHEGN